jgi:hypothetical protein
MALPDPASVSALRLYNHGVAAVQPGKLVVGASDGSKTTRREAMKIAYEL